MIQYLHDPSILKVEQFLGAAFAGVLGLWYLAARIRSEKKRDISRPETFKSEMYAEDDIEEIVVEGAPPIPIVPQAPKAVTPRRVVVAIIFFAFACTGSWFGIRNYRILRSWDAGDNSFAQYDFKGAEQFYNSAEKIDPLVRKSHRLIANALLKQNELARAIPELRAAANGENNDPQIYILLGDTLQSLDRTAEALPAYQRAIFVAPKLVIAYVRLGSCLVKLNRVAGAIKQFKYAIFLDPKNIMAISNLGSLEVLIGQPEDGIQLLRKAVALAPTEVGTHNTLGTAYARTRNFGSAVEEFRAELAIDPQFTPGYYNLGSALDSMGDFKGAEDAFTSYLRNTFSLSANARSPDASVGVQKAFNALQRLQKLHPIQKPPRKLAPGMRQVE